LVAAVAGIGTFALLEHSSNPWLRLIAIGLAMTLPYSGILWLLRGTAPIEGLIRLVKSVLAPAKPSSALK
jgi:hypothetical protein